MANTGAKNAPVSVFISTLPDDVSNPAASDSQEEPSEEQLVKEELDRRRAMLWWKRPSPWWYASMAALHYCISNPSQVFNTDSSLLVSTYVNLACSRPEHILAKCPPLRARLQCSSLSTRLSASRYVPNMLQVQSPNIQHQIQSCVAQIL
jgi:hypothetical protein